MEDDATPKFTEVDVVVSNHPGREKNQFESAVVLDTATSIKDKEFVANEKDPESIFHAENKVCIKRFSYESPFMIYK